MTPEDFAQVNQTDNNGVEDEENLVDEYPAVEDQDLEDPALVEDASDEELVELDDDLAEEDEVDDVEEDDGQAEGIIADKHIDDLGPIEEDG